MAKTAELFPDPFSLLPPIFRDCVDEETIRFCLAYPQPVGGYVCATDGRIFIRMPLTPAIAESLPSIAPKKFPESGLTLFGPRTNWLAEPSPIPALAPLKPCRHCDGLGQLEERQCSCGNWDDSDTPCRGKGTIPAGPCDDCDGKGVESSGAEFFEFRKDVKLGEPYLRILEKHGATLYLPATTNTWECVTPAYFTVDGGVDGVLMPASLDRPEYKSRKVGAQA